MWSSRPRHRTWVPVPTRAVEIDINDVIVALTDANGRLTMTLPTDEEKAEIGAKLGEAEGEVKIEF